MDRGDPGLGGPLLGLGRDPALPPSTTPWSCALSVGGYCYPLFVDKDMEARDVRDLLQTAWLLNGLLWICLALKLVAQWPWQATLRAQVAAGWGTKSLGGSWTPGSNLGLVKLETTCSLNRGLGSPCSVPGPAPDTEMHTLRNGCGPYRCCPCPHCAHCSWESTQ